MYAPAGPTAPSLPSDAADVFADYADRLAALGARDEALTSDATPRPLHARALQALNQLSPDERAERQARVEHLEVERGITFRVTGEDKPRVFPMDFYPRIISAQTWRELSAGLEQRARALNAFLDDVYGDQAIIDAGIIDARDVEQTPGYVPSGRLQPAGAVRAHICGMDLVCTQDGTWLVLEDNLRVPSGIIFAHSMRQIIAEVFGDVVNTLPLHDTLDAFVMVRDTLVAAAPEHGPQPGAPQIALVSSGESDSAWFEHRRIAELVGMPVCTPDQLMMRDGYLHHRDESGQLHPLDVVYARIEENTLFTARGCDGEQLGPGLTQALRERRLAFANAFGNGVADDKAMYASVPDMIRFYLGEQPLLGQVPTTLCHGPGKLDGVLERLDQLVVKPVDGYGGSGITIGPECDADDLRERASQLRAHPEHFIAQDIVRLSTLPTYSVDSAGQEDIHPRHVDLRVFVHVRAGADGWSAHAVPAALTRTAAAGTLIVNTSRGGGGKDTWILRDDPAPAG